MKDKKCNYENCNIFEDIINDEFGYCPYLAKDIDDPINGLVLKNQPCQLPELEKIYGKEFWKEIK